MNQIPFPANFDVYFTNAMNEMANGNISGTVAFIQKALDIQMEEELFQVCLTLLKDANQPSDALKLIQKHKPFLYESNQLHESDLSLITLLIAIEDFEEARKQIRQRWGVLGNDPNHSHIKNILERYLDQIEAQSQKRKNEEISAVLAESQIIASKPYYAQMAFVQTLDKLPAEVFIEIVRPLLVSEAIHPLLKTELLLQFLNRDLNIDLKISKHQLIKTVAVNGLKKPDETVFYLNGLAEIEKMPTSMGMEKHMYHELLFLHVLYFYPFERDILHSAEEWLATVRNPHCHSSIADAIHCAEKGLDLLT